MWKKISINIQNIEYSNSESTLIKMPHNSKYDGYSFWHLSKLMHNGKHSYAATLVYTNEFTFDLIKYGKGKYNKFQVIDKIKINVLEFEEAFGVMNENIVAPKTKSDYETHKPNVVEAVEVKVLNELKDE